MILKKTLTILAVSFMMNPWATKPEANPSLKSFQPSIVFPPSKKIK